MKAENNAKPKSSVPHLSRWSKRLQSQLLGNQFLTCYHMFCRVVCYTSLIVQLAIVDYYLVNFNNWLWLLWIIPDVIVLTLFALAFIFSYQHLEKRPIIPEQSQLRRFGGEMPLTFITWFVYAAVLSAKICCLYDLPDSVATRLVEKWFFGPNMLRTAVSLSSIILYLLVLTSHDARSHSTQNDFIQSIVGSVYLDVLDTSQFLGALLQDLGTLMEYHLHHIILAIICFNLILPAEGLFVLSKKHFGKMPVSIKFQMLHKICYFVVVNLPFFIVRMLIWHLNDGNVSVFLIKNILGIGLAIKDIHEFTLELTEVIKSEFQSLDDLLEAGGAGAAGDPGAEEMQTFRSSIAKDNKVDENVDFKSVDT